ncbi:MAG: dipeptide/oligopeptide/nickel ABC transporter ATP-binding protein [Chloroflexi bacterium]|nr:MAG: dipeptide/oligopeptide/nickel ABC transporter ATP-binding protein [Chloroflexota bacterium]
MDSSAILSVRNLRTYFKLDEGTLKAVDGVDFDLPKMKTLGMIGESGCGKSVTAYSIMRTVLPPGRIVEGALEFRRSDGEITDLARLDPFGPVMRSIRGKEIAMIFQEPMASLSPVHTIGDQIMEMVLLHRTRNKKEAREIVLEMLDKVGLPNPAQRFAEYPHQMSGGMCQRSMIAQALSCNPSVLIADEPTTALDVTVQAQIIELIRSLQEEFGMAVLYITHDLGVIAEIADAVAVMYLGRIVELADTRTIFKNPLHPYTQRLLKAIPTLSGPPGGYLENISGNVPVPLDPPAECGFYSRCLIAQEGLCNTSVPPLVEVEPGHQVRCFLVEQEGKRLY